MKPFHLSLAELKPALVGLGKVILKRVTLPVLGHIRLERSATGELSLAVTDLDTYAVFRASNLCHPESAVILVPAEDLNKIVKRCGYEDALLITPAGDNELLLQFPVNGQMIEHRCGTLPVVEYPAVPEFTGDGISIDASLREAIHAALECGSSDPTRYILNGACLDVSKSSGHYVVGTDGKHLFSANSFALPLKESLIVPDHRFLDWKGFNADGDWTLRVTSTAPTQCGWFEIASNHWRFMARAREGQYPNWEVAIPGASSFRTEIDIHPDQVAAFMDAIQRIPCHSEKHHTIGLEVTTHKVQLLGRSREDTPWAKVPVDVQRIDGPSVTTFVDRQLLLKALRFGLTRIQIADSISPLRLSEGGRQMIVMPLRPDNAPTPTESPDPATSSPSPSPPPADSPQTHTMPTYEGHPAHTTVMPEAPRSITAAEIAKGRNGSDTNPAEKPALEAALAQIDSIKSEFREAIGGLSKLGDLLKQAVREQKTNEKEVQSVRSTLRSLQSVRI